MCKTAVLFADGFEESEALTIVDIFRRAGMEAIITGVTGKEITGAHGICVQADALLSELKADDLDMAVLPGGYDGVDVLEKDPAVLNLIRNMYDQGKFTASICAAARVLDKAGVLEGHHFTCYPGQEKLISRGIHETAPVVTDGHVITAIGPAVCYAFAYRLVEALGGDAETVKAKMVYPNAFDEKLSHSDPCPENVPLPEDAKKVAVLMKEGYEEGETFSIVDILRRLNITCDTFADSEVVRGMHGMMIRSDKIFPGDIEEYDAVVLPGGRPGGPNLIADQRIMDLLKRFNETPGKILSALCFGTRALAAADVIEGKRMTGYTGYDQYLTGAVFVSDLTVSDQNLVTSQGPATGYPFAFKLAEVLGYDTRIVRSRLMYDYAGGKN